MRVCLVCLFGFLVFFKKKKKKKKKRDDIRNSRVDWIECIIYILTSVCVCACVRFVSFPAKTL